MQFGFESDYNHFVIEWPILRWHRPICCCSLIESTITILRIPNSTVGSTCTRRTVCSTWYLVQVPMPGVRRVLRRPQSTVHVCIQCPLYDSTSHVVEHPLLPCIATGYLCSVKCEVPPVDQYETSTKKTKCHHCRSAHHAITSVNCQPSFACSSLNRGIDWKLPFVS